MLNAKFHITEKRGSRKGGVHAKAQRSAKGAKKKERKGTAYLLAQQKDRIAGSGRIAAPLLGGAGGGFTYGLCIIKRSPPGENTPVPNLSQIPSCNGLFLR
jgi:hypothetical protein